MDNELLNKFTYQLYSMKKFFLDMDLGKKASRSEFVMLDFIRIFGENGKVTTSLLSEHLGITKPAVSQMINILENKHYVKREIDKDDKRVYCLALTDLGMDLLRQEGEQYMHIMNKLFDRLGKENTEKLIEIMDLSFSCLRELKENNEI
ncbi:MAG: MarR family transcriptional regulator [Clostridia bacterium]|nr:MarR family transcriptional regulator [Clostridia bacterium]